MARLMGLGELTRIGDKSAIDRIIAMMRDPHESVSWRARAVFRSLTGQTLGPDPAAYEKWWVQNRDNYIPGSGRMHRRPG